MLWGHRTTTSRSWGILVPSVFRQADTRRLFQQTPRRPQDLAPLLRLFERDPKRRLLLKTKNRYVGRLACPLVLGALHEGSKLLYRFAAERQDNVSRQEASLGGQAVF